MKNLILLTALSATLFAFNTEAKSKGIINFEQASEGIFRGARPLNSSEIETLKERGIKSIVNLQGGDLHGAFAKIYAMYEPGERPDMIESEKNAASALSMDFLSAPLNSYETVSASEDKVINGILDYMNDQSHWPIYVHCEHGHDRTGLIIALYKVKNHLMSIEDAHTEWVSKGHEGIGKIFTGELDEYFAEKVKEYN